MNERPLSELLEEAFVGCRDMDASLADRLQAFADAVRDLGEVFQSSVGELVARLREQRSENMHRSPVSSCRISFCRTRTVILSVSRSSPKEGPVAVVFHRGHWCPYCRINTKALAETQDQVAAVGGQIVAIMPDRQHYTSALQESSGATFPILTDFDNGYAMSLNLAFWVGDEMQSMMCARPVGTSSRPKEATPGCCRFPRPSSSARTGWSRRASWIRIIVSVWRSRICWRRSRTRTRPSPTTTANRKPAASSSWRRQRQCAGVRRRRRDDGTLKIDVDDLDALQGGTVLGAERHEGDARSRFQQ